MKEHGFRFTRLVPSKFLPYYLDDARPGMLLKVVVQFWWSWCEHQFAGVSSSCISRLVYFK
jgi:hypothetical protein